MQSARAKTQDCWMGFVALYVVRVDEFRLRNAPRIGKLAAEEGAAKIT